MVWNPECRKIHLGVSQAHGNGVKYKWMGEKQESPGAAPRIPTEQNPGEVFPPQLSSQGSCSTQSCGGEGLHTALDQGVRPASPLEGAGVGMVPLGTQGSWIVPFRCPKSWWPWEFGWVWVPRANQERVLEVRDAWSLFQMEFPQCQAAVPVCVGISWHGLIPLLHPEFTMPGMWDNGI